MLLRNALKIIKYSAKVYHEADEVHEERNGIIFLFFAAFVYFVVNKDYWSKIKMKIWKEKFKIRNYEADFNNKVKISSIFNYMQEAASLHADILKFRI